MVGLTSASRSVSGIAGGVQSDQRLARHADELEPRAEADVGLRRLGLRHDAGQRRASACLARRFEGMHDNADPTVSLAAKYRPLGEHVVAPVRHPGCERSGGLARVLDPTVRDERSTKKQLRQVACQAPVEQRVQPAVGPVLQAGVARTSAWLAVGSDVLAVRGDALLDRVHQLLQAAFARLEVAGVAGAVEQRVGEIDLAAYAQGRRQRAEARGQLLGCGLKHAPRRLPEQVGRREPRGSSFDPSRIQVDLGRQVDGTEQQGVGHLAAANGGRVKLLVEWRHPRRWGVALGGVEGALNQQPLPVPTSRRDGATECEASALAAGISCDELDLAASRGEVARSGPRGRCRALVEGHSCQTGAGDPGVVAVVVRRPSVDGAVSEGFGHLGHHVAVLAALGTGDVVIGGAEGRVPAGKARAKPAAVAERLGHRLGTPAWADLVLHHAYGDVPAAVPDDAAARGELADRDLRVAVDRQVVDITKVSWLVQVEVALPRGHAVHRQEAVLGELLGEVAVAERVVGHVRGVLEQLSVEDIPQDGVWVLDARLTKDRGDDVGHQVVVAVDPVLDRLARVGP